MKKRLPFLRCSSFLFLLLLISASLSAQQVKLGDELMSRMISDSVFRISPNITEIHLHYLNKEGNPMAVYILKARLKKNELSLEAATPFNKDTFCRQTLMEQMKWENASHHRVLAGVNADFFNMKSGVPVEMEIKEGIILRDTIRQNRSFAGVLKNGKVIIGNESLYHQKKRKLQEALGGYPLLVKNGKIIPQLHHSFSLTRHPRTALGIINPRKLLLVVVDGRQPKYSNGMPLEELALLMKALGAKTAINLDGGGSSTFISLDAGQEKWKVRNRPSDGQQRKIANAWILVNTR